MKSRVWCSLVGAFLLAGSVSAQAGQFGDYTYESSGSGVIITKYTGRGGAVVIPATIDGLPVTSIGEWAFGGCSSLTSVTIPNSVTNIANLAFFDSSLSAITVEPTNPSYSSVDGVLFGKNQTTLIRYPRGRVGTTYAIPSSVTTVGHGAFYSCSNLTSVMIPDSVTTIGGQVFDECTRLSGITLGNSVTTLGHHAFSDCKSLIQITIPNSVISIGYSAFYCCTNLTTVAIGNSVTSIGDDAFYGCTSLTNIVIPDLVTNLGNGAFVACTRLASVTLPNRLTAIGHSTFNWCTSLASITIPDTVISIGQDAFSQCSSLTNVTLPNNVSSIGQCAFACCTRLAAIRIPANLSSIGYGPFFGCTSLSTIEVDPANPSYSDIDGVLFDKSRAALIQCPGARAGSFTVPNGVTSIWDFAFSGCTSLTSVTIPNGVTNIAREVFSGCSNLVSVSIPASVSAIGESAFTGCAGLIQITIPNSVITIADWAFDGCSSLTAIEVAPLNPVYCSLDGVLFDKTQTTLIRCPGGKAGAYLIPNSVTTVGHGAFYSCVNLASMSIPQGVTNMAGPPFLACTQLTMINVDARNFFYRSVDGVLFNKSQTTLIRYPGGRAGSYAIAEGVTQIGWGALSGCTGLAAVGMPDSLNLISYGAFSGCTSLTRVTIPRRVTTIACDSFWGCTNLVELYFEGDAPGIKLWGCGEFPRLLVADLQWRLIPGTVYYLPGSTGWASEYRGFPTAPWHLPHPTILTTAPNLGIQTNGFGFRISWATNTSVLVEASTSLSSPSWLPVITNTLTDGWVDFRDPQWANHPNRFFRIRSL